MTKDKAVGMMESALSVSHAWQQVAFMAGARAPRASCDSSCLHTCSLWLLIALQSRAKEMEALVRDGRGGLEERMACLFTVCGRGHHCYLIELPRLHKGGKVHIL